MPIDDVLVWLDAEQKKPERWTRNEHGVLRFTLTGPELQRLRSALATVVGHVHSLTNAKLELDR